MEKKFALVEHESETSLMEHLRARYNAYITLGDKIESPERFYSMEIDGLGVGISSRFGIRPSAIVVSNGIAIVGYDCRISGVDTRAVERLFDLATPAPFYCFLPGRDDRSVLVVHELGLRRISDDGAVKWSIDTDVVEEFQQRGTRVTLKAMVTPKAIVVDIENGQIVDRE
jgi:hypothetical protein